MPRWIVQYVFPDDDGETRISHLTVEAESKEAAGTKAAEFAPAEEFVFSVHPETDEQFLGNVRQQALAMSGHGFEPKDED